MQASSAGNGRSRSARTKPSMSSSADRKRFPRTYCSTSWRRSRRAWFPASRSTSPRAHTIRGRTAKLCDVFAAQVGASGERMTPFPTWVASESSCIEVR